MLGPSATFGTAPFTVGGRWSYIPAYPPFNIAGSWAPKLLESLGRSQAFTNADSALASRVLFDLRNALAHGGVAYLDGSGEETDREAEMLAFASAKLNRSGLLIGLNILRVRQDDFCAFLMAWADWLAQPSVRNVLNTLSPLTA